MGRRLSLAVPLAGMFCVCCPAGAGAEPPGPQTADAARVAELVRQLGSEAFAERQAAATALRALGAGAYGLLHREMVHAEDAQLRQQLRQLCVSACLTQLTGAVLPSGEQPLRDLAAQRDEALQGLRLLDEDAALVLGTALKAEAWETRVAAAYPLGSLGPAARRTLPDLAAALHDALRDVRVSVVCALGRLAPQLDGAAQALLAAPADTSVDVRVLVAAYRAKADAAAGERDRPLAELLTAVADLSADGEVARLRTAAGSWPVRLAWEGPAPAFRGLFDDDFLELRENANMGLRTRVCAALALCAGVWPEQAWEPLLVRVYDNLPEDSACRAMAVIALGQQGHLGPTGVSTLIRAVRDENDAVSELAIEALERTGPCADAAIPALLNVLRDHPNWHMQRKAARALGFLGPHARVALPALQEASRNEKDYILRTLAQAAIERLTP